MRRLLAPIGLLVTVTALSATGPAHAQAPAAPAFCFGFDLLGGDATELLEGTSGADHVAGFGGDDDIVTFGGEDCASGGGGDDHLRLGPADDDGFGRSGSDLIEGGPGRDALAAGPGADALRGGEDADLLRDEPGDSDRDELDGGPGDDVLHAGAGGDALLGGPGDDVLHAANAAADAVDCGEGGADRAFADAADAVTGCETVTLGFRPAVRATTPRGTTFWLRWDGGAPAGERRVQLVDAPPLRRGCSRDVGWRVRVSAREARLRWRGRHPKPCPGTYVWRVVAVVTGDGARIDCERRADRATAKGAPPETGCAPRELVGAASVAVRPR